MKIHAQLSKVKKNITLVLYKTFMTYFRGFILWCNEVIKYFSVVWCIWFTTYKLSDPKLYEQPMYPFKKSVNFILKITFEKL